MTRLERPVPRLAMFDPAADIRAEISDASGMPELPEKIWFHRTAAAVIDAGRCVGCGGCIAACPSRSISVGEDGHPTLIQMCTGCSACWDYCPRSGLRAERISKQARTPNNDGEYSIGEVLGAVSARAIRRADHAQDGGVVTALLSTLLESGHIDGVIATRKVDAFHGEAFIATHPGEVLEAAGSVYHQGHPLAMLNQTGRGSLGRLAFVGTPCQISVLRALQLYPWKNRDSLAGHVVLAVSLFCTRSFDAEKLQAAIAARGIDVGAVGKIDVRSGHLTAENFDGQTVLSAKVAEFRGAALAGCTECADFTGLGADISVGNLASGAGESTVLIRSQAGVAAWEVARAALRTKALDDTEPLVKAATRQRKAAEKGMARSFDPEGSPWIGYLEHLGAYWGTDRAPTAPPAHRSQSYDVSC